MSNSVRRPIFQFTIPQYRKLLALWIRHLHCHRSMHEHGYCILARVPLRSTDGSNLLRRTRQERRDGTHELVVHRTVSYGAQYSRSRQSTKLGMSSSPYLSMAQSDRIQAFSRDGALPFSSFFRRVSPRLMIPVRAVWGCAFAACILGLLCLIAPAAAAALFSLAVAGNNVAWGTPIFCRLVWGQSKFKPGPVYTGDKLSRPIGWLAIAFLIFGILLAMFPASGPNPTPETMNYTVVINCAVWGGSLLYYFIGQC